MIICHWKWVGKKWKFVESYQIDEDGYRTNGGKHEWLQWMSSGKAATIWSIESGVRLLDFKPPDDTKWLSIGFVDELKKLSNWFAFLQDGHSLYLGTAREAEKYL